MSYASGGQKSLESIDKENLVRVCPDCGCKDIEYANEEPYCRKCGLVMD